MMNFSKLGLIQISFTSGSSVTSIAMSTATWTRLTIVMNIVVPIVISIYQNDSNVYDDNSYDIEGISFKTLADDAGQSNSPSAGVIASAIVGGVAFIALVVVAVLLCRRSKQRCLLAFEKPPNQTPSSVPLSPSGRHGPARVGRPTRATFGAYTCPAVMPLPEMLPPEAIPNAHSSLEGHRASSSSGNTSTVRNTRPAPTEEGQRDSPSSRNTSTVRNTLPTVIASSSTGDIPPEQPPPYGHLTVLARWARANRNAITEDMEAKLLEARYMPGDDPDILSEDEWQTRYGLTRLELRRLHARSGSALNSGLR